MAHYREAQFLAALLECGNVSHTVMPLYAGAGVPWIPAEFIAHKRALIDHLQRADYFDVYQKWEVHGAKGQQLTPTAALWIGEFYSWLLRMQKEKEDERRAG